MAHMRYVTRAQRLPLGSTVDTRRGSVTVLTPPGDIHAVVNDSAVVAASLHVYGADLRERGTSVRRCYRMPVR